jgi:hypothetical protein
MDADRIDLLALCRIDGLSWYLVAREARRPGARAARRTDARRGA